MLLANARVPVDGLFACERVVEEKLCEALQKTTILVRRTAVRDEAVKCLRSNSLAAMIQLLRRVKMEQLDLSADARKAIAFACAQTVALDMGKELYQKEAAAACFPYLREVLYRRDASGLDQIVDACVRLAEEYQIYQQGSMVALQSKHRSCVCSFAKNRVRCEASWRAGAGAVAVLRWSAQEAVGFAPIRFMAPKELRTLPYDAGVAAYAADGRPVHL